MEKQKYDYPSHVRTNRDPFIHHRIEQAKKVIKLKTGRSNIPDREALRFLLDQTNNGNSEEVVHTQLQIFKNTCCLSDPSLRNFPYKQLGQIFNQLFEDILTTDDVKAGFLAIIAQGNRNFMKNGDKNEEKK